MTEQEVGKLIKVVKATYPMQFRAYTTQDYQNMIKAWQFVLEDFTYEEAGAGLKVYLRNDSKGFPPSPGQVADCIKKIQDHADVGMSMTALEAWSLVRKAIKNSTYHFEEEFEALPELCQKAIGNAHNLYDMAQQPSDTVASVEQSHFIRSYNTIVQREKERKAFPVSIQAMINRRRTESLSDRQNEVRGIAERENVSKATESQHEALRDTSDHTVQIQELERRLGVAQ